ncbi:cytochrome oxidase [Myxococcus qinghaiensis]|uniref:cytochrome oxidase n=1 Tax=Myxococcus qinghaiensis TaxID=2906758 RepID=UPI0020A7A149|nr:cytochrome oxidase [Myxococcus qinghaiensis]MCP3162513.1 cytochrome oxidase [Myxococcus qinghaiensis]
MNVLVLQVFVSLMLVASSVLLFIYSMRHRDHEQADRLALFPLEEDSVARPTASSDGPSSSASQE